MIVEGTLLDGWRDGLKEIGVLRPDVEDTWDSQNKNPTARRWTQGERMLGFCFEMRRPLVGRDQKKVLHKFDQHWSELASLVFNSITPEKIPLAQTQRLQGSFTVFHIPSSSSSFPNFPQFGCQFFCLDYFRSFKWQLYNQAPMAPPAQLTCT